MKNYSDKTNEEINIEVAELRGVNWWLPPSNSSSGGWEYCKVPKLITKQDCKLPDYCNNWADAGPVMLENRIGIETTALSSEWMARTCSTNMSNMMFRCSKHKNPLRAAMIVFLMIKGDETRILAPDEVSDE